MNDVVAQFQILQQNWYAPCWNAAVWLFQVLAIIELGVAFIFWLLESRSFEQIVEGFGKKLIYLGAMYSFLAFADDWIPAIIQAGVQAGSAAAQIDSLSPSEVVMMGMSVGLKMLQEMIGWGMLFNASGIIIGQIAALFIIVSFGVMGVQMGLTLIKSYVMCGAGVLFLGLSSFHGTSTISERYLFSTIGVGVQLFAIYLIVGAGALFAPQWAEAINSTSILDFNVAAMVAFSAVLYATVAWQIPKMLGEMVSGGASLGFHDVLSTAYAFTNMAGAAGKVAVAGGAVGGAIGSHVGNSVLNMIRGGSSTSSGGGSNFGTGSGGGGANNGPVPKLNSTPAGGKPTP